MHVGYLHVNLLHGQLAPNVNLCRDEDDHLQPPAQVDVHPHSLCGHPTLEMFPATNLAPSPSVADSLSAVDAEIVHAY